MMSLLSGGNRRAALFSRSCCCCWCCRPYRLLICSFAACGTCSQFKSQQHVGAQFSWVSCHATTETVATATGGCDCLRIKKKMLQTNLKCAQRMKIHFGTVAHFLSFIVSLSRCCSLFWPISLWLHMAATDSCKLAAL